MTTSLPQIRRPGAVKAVLLATAFLAMLNETSVNVALATLMGVFAVPVSTVQWLVTGFMLVMAVVVPTTAYLQARFTTRGLYFASVALLVAGGLLGALAPAFGVLLAGRLVQAVGTCVLMSLTVTTVIRLTPPEGRGGAMGLVGLVTLFAPAVAPTFGGLVLQTLGWPWLLGGTLPVLVLLGGTAYRFLEDVGETRTLGLDFASVVLAALGFGGLILGLGSLDPRVDQPAFVVGSLGLGVAALAAFALRQGVLKEPLVDLRVFLQPQFSLAMVFVVVCILEVFGLTVLTPLALGQVWGLGAAAAGLAMLPGGLVNGLTAPLFGRLSDLWGPRGLALGGVALMGGALLGLAWLPGSAPAAWYLAGHVVFLLGTSAAMTVNQANGMNALPAALVPHGTAVMSTLMQLAGGIGTALSVAALAGIPGAGAPPEAAFHGAFLGGAGVLVLPLVAAWFLRPAQPPSVPPPGKA